MIITNATWCDKTHRAFDVQIEDSIYGSVPYTFCLNSDYKSDIYIEIEKLFKAGDINIKECIYDDSPELVAESIRIHRDNLLAETDKYMTIDYPISKEVQDLMRAYRQALRDVPQQDGFPDNVIWPEKPSVK